MTSETSEISESGAQGAPPVERRLHFLTPLRRAWVPIAAILGVAVQQGENIAEWVTALSLLLRAVALISLVLVFGLYGFLSWWFTHYAVTDTELRIRSGLLFRRTAHIRLDRIQAIDVTRPLLARVAGVAKLRLDVIGTDAKDELAFLSEDDAGRLRAELLARAAGFTPAEAVALGEAPERELLRVTPQDLAVSMLLTLSAWAAIIGGLTAPVAVWWLSSNPWAAAAALLPMLGAVWSGSAGRFLTEYDWTVAESPDGLRLDHGLLDRAHETVPPGRVQSVRIVEPLLWRRRGWVRVELSVAARTTTSWSRWPPGPPPTPSSPACCPAWTWPDWSSPRRPGEDPAGWCRSGGRGTGWPSPRTCSRPARAACAGVRRSSRTPRCRACATPRARGSGPAAWPTYTWTPARTGPSRPACARRPRPPGCSTPRPPAPVPPGPRHGRTAG